MKKIILTAIIVISSTVMFAQPLPPTTGTGGAGGTGPMGGGAPIDGGLSILLILGAAFGTKKVYSLKKKTVKGE